ncbi:MAG: hypothetical protein ACTSRC_18270 [Candidatus Helarchaeota archaeon]
METDLRTACLFKKTHKNKIFYCTNTLSLNFNLPATFKRCLECHDRDPDGKLRHIGIISTPRSPKWNYRILFEKIELKRLLSFIKRDAAGFYIEKFEFDWKNSRIITCHARFHGRSLQFKIRLNFKYPFDPPRCCDFSYETFTGRHAALGFVEDDPFEMFRHACLGKIEKRWKSDGSMSIAQYLQLFLFYTAIEHFNQRI